MKPFIYRLLSLLLLSKVVLGQPVATDDNSNPCLPLLRDGLYSNFKMTRTGSFDQDLKSYFASEKFELDLHSGKWGGSVSIPLVGSIGADSSTTELKHFQEAIRKYDFSHLSTYDYQTIISSIPNTDLAKTYADCVREHYKAGFRVQSQNGSDWANFIISYRKEIDSDPMPNLLNLKVVNGQDVSSGLTPGKSILNYNLVSSKRDSKKDLVLEFETDRGVVTHRIPADPEPAQESPVGTVISSILPFDVFSTATKNNIRSKDGLWAAASSFWSPADGRNISGSALSKYSRSDYAPDLRGVFLRGLNILDSQVPVKLDPMRKDPDDRQVGSYQPDALKTHTHKIERDRQLAPAGPARELFTLYSGSSGTSVETSAFPEGKQVDETRPKNVAVYFYIRIN